MTTRMSAGITVQATSSAVLCVVREGLGLARSLKRMIMINSSANTKTVITAEMMVTKMWKSWIAVMIGVTEV